MATSYSIITPPASRTITGFRTAAVIGSASYFKLKPLSADEPFWALIKVDFRLVRGVTATVEVSPVEGIVTQALRFYLVQKRAFYFPAAFSTISARITVGPIRIDLDGSKVRCSHGRSRPGKRAYGSAFQIEIGQVVGETDHMRGEMEVLPESETSKKPVAEEGRQDITPHARCHTHCRTEDK